MVVVSTCSADLDLEADLGPIPSPPSHLLLLLAFLAERRLLPGRYWGCKNLFSKVSVLSWFCPAQCSSKTSNSVRLLDDFGEFFESELSFAPLSTGGPGACSLD